MINNGVSIYNFGGGGGGYSDGGELVDGDFINVPNNAISKYENTSRSNINFVVQPGDEQINAVVELTNGVNSTIHVYTVQNGIYIPLGNIGGDTVTSGEKYNINIVGNLFTVEHITGGGVDPEYATINGVVYPVLKLNNLLWQCSDLKDDSYAHTVSNGNYYYAPNESMNIDGWRLPTSDEWNDLINQYGMPALKTTTGWGGYAGTNTSGFGANAFGYWSLPYNEVQQYDWRMVYICIQSAECVGVTEIANDPVSFGFNIAAYRCTVRLVKDYT